MPSSVVLALVLTLLPGPAAAEPGDLADRIDEASQRLEVVIEDYNELREDLAATRARAKALDRRMAPLMTQLEARRDRVGRLAAAAYRSGGINRATVLLGARSARDVADRLLLLEYFARKQQREIAGLLGAEQRYRTARHHLDLLTARQQAQERALAAQRAQIEAEIARLEQLRDEGHEPYQVSVPPPPRLPPGEAGDVVRFAYAQIGKRYRYAASGPDAYDCSGLTSAAYRHAGVRLPHNSRRQWRSVTPIKRSQLRPGDLIFYYGDIHHVAVYAGDGKMIHAPRHGEPVRMDRVDRLPVHGYGRVHRGR